MEIRFNIQNNSPDMLWQQVKDQLKNYISENKVPVGTQLPNVKVVALQAGVSLKTSERALQELVKEGTCFRRPKKGTFVGNGYAAPTVSRICGICHHENLDSFEGDILHSQVFQGIRMESCNICDTFSLNGSPEESIRRYLEQRSFEMCGVIMLHWVNLTEGVDLANKFPDLRFIFVNYLVDNFENTPSNVYGVFNDDFGGAYQLADSLLTKGHKRFGIVSLDQENQNYERRIEGFCSCVQSHGLKVPDDNILSAPRDKKVYNLDDLRELGQLQAEKLLDSDKVPSVIFAPNDYLAEGALQAIEANGMAGEIEVAGYDAFAPFRQQIKFSTVAIDFEKMGRIAVKLLTDKSSYFSKITYVNPQLLIKN
jgi:DNA-binding LacI/PurR family transcriptional regulator